MIIIFAVPCTWIASESITLQFLGWVYTIEYYRGFIRPIIKRVNVFS